MKNKTKHWKSRKGVLSYCNRVLIGLTWGHFSDGAVKVLVTVQ